MPTKKIVLQIDGGGIRGIIPAMVLAALEQQLREHTKNPDLKMHHLLSLCSGTSTGAIIAGMVCAGVEAANIQTFYQDDGVRLFTESKRPWYLWLSQSKYNRAPFMEKLDDMLTTVSERRDPHISLGQLPSKGMFMATAYNLNSCRTHFIKSDDPKDHHRQLREVIAWSALSAAFYFGKIDVPDYDWLLRNADTPPVITPQKGAVFQDGGQGTQNCTLGFVLTEIFARRWDPDQVIIISLGTGNHTQSQSFAQAVKMRNFWQTIAYLRGQAQKEAMPIQIFSAEYVASKNPNIRLFRLDYETCKNYKLDDVKSVDVYKQGAYTIIQSSVFQNLVAALF